MFGDWILRYAGTEYRFGPKSRPVGVVGWAFAANSYRVDDASRPRADGISFGRDYVEAGELRLELIIDYSGRPEPAAMRARMAWETRHELELAWRADTLRQRPRAVAELVLGSEEMIEGRPRRISFDDSAQNVGLVRATATFLPSSTAIYTVDEGGVAPWFEQAVNLVPAQIGGITSPLVAPISTAASSSRARPFTVGGAAPVWPIVTVNGPIQAGAQFELVGGWSLTLNRALAYDDEVSVDTRPDRQIMTYNGRPANVLAPSSSRITAAAISPGLNEIALRGVSIEGTASAKIRWREQKAG